MAPPIPVDFVAQCYDMMARERRETTTMLGSRLEAFTDSAESRDRNLRDKLRLIKSELKFGQHDSSPRPPPPAQRSPTLHEQPQQLTSARLAFHECEHPAQDAVQAIPFYYIFNETRASASADPWTAAGGNLDPWLRPGAQVELNIIQKAGSVRANQLRDRTEGRYDPYTMDRIAPGVHYGIPHQDVSRIDMYASGYRKRDSHPYNNVQECKLRGVAPRLQCRNRNLAARH